MYPFFSLCRDKSSFSNIITINQLICFCLITCCSVDGLAHHTSAGVTTSQDGNGIVLPTRQVTEITVGVSAVALSVVTETAPGIDSIRCGATCRVPCNHSDASLAVHLCCKVGGNTRSLWRERAPFSSVYWATITACIAQAWGILSIYFTYFILYERWNDVS